MMADDDQETDDNATNDWSTGRSHSYHSYYVDEAGDSTLFNRKGRLIVGTEGCSRFFILGKLDVKNPTALATALNELRQTLLQDSCFAGVPSMSLEKRKTARLFHAKDDVAEVRRDVFRLLLDFDVRFYALVRDKMVIAKKVLEFNLRRPKYRYGSGELTTQHRSKSWHLTRVKSIACRRSTISFGQPNDALKEASTVT